jgi:hypothetical protein
LGAQLPRAKRARSYLTLTQVSPGKSDRAIWEMAEMPKPDQLTPAETRVLHFEDDGGREAPKLHAGVRLHCRFKVGRHRFRVQTGPDGELQILDARFNRGGTGVAPEALDQFIGSVLLFEHAVANFALAEKARA